MSTAKYSILNMDARTLPGDFPDNLDLFFIGDVHGRAGALSACLQALDAVERHPGRQRNIVFFGDLIDRGPDSLGAVRLAMSAGGIDDDVRVLPGNHELLLLDVLAGHPPGEWVVNGGLKVMNEVDRGWRDLRWPDALTALRAAIPAGFEERLRAAPSHLQFGDVLCVHAGLHPHMPPDEHLERARPHRHNDQHWATIRSPFLNWQGGWNWDGEHYGWGDTVVVHGHTPAVRMSLLTDPDGLQPCDGIDTHRTLCLDAGATTRDQIAWAQIWSEGSQAMVQVHAATMVPEAWCYDV
ncbi:metallophosphoesterase [Tropicibacter alexandrii]|uniref:metallophosphoesterase n=1 Tax=Tropicibacter alexandrii TaxID=2267683 RepID=UPI000EF50AF9|nr:metallophosphoesterase [Tropicibacter alexandrii]